VQSGRAESGLSSDGADVNERVLVLGAAGMLGHKLFQCLSASRDTLAVVRLPWAELSGLARQILPRERTLDGVDAADWDGLAKKLDDVRPAVVINCIGVIKQRAEACSAIPSLTINALLPHRLAEHLALWGGRLIHFSTDCVFSGTRGHYLEDDQSDAVDLYGKSKYLGEVATGNAITLRTSIIGRELTGHRSLLDWFLLQRGKSIRGFRRAIYSGITTNQMASVVQLIIDEHPTLSGLFQVVSEPIGKYDLLILLREAYGLDTPIEPDDSEICDRSMQGDRFAGATGWQAPTWPEMVAQLAADRTPYPPTHTQGLGAKRLEPRNV
jgi:dTDP-4-dehydrorhamnose reductase